MNALKEALDRRGLTCPEAARRGVPYHNLIKQYKGIRGVGPKAAILYEAVFIEYLYDLRPTAACGYINGYRLVVAAVRRAYAAVIHQNTGCCPDYDNRNHGQKYHKLLL